MNPIEGGDKEGTNQDEKMTIPAQIGLGSPNSKGGGGQKRDRSGQGKPRSRQKKCDLCVTCERMPEDLKRVMMAWGKLSEEDRRAISEVVKSAEACQ